MSQSVGTIPRVEKHSFLGPFGMHWQPLSRPDDPDLEGCFQRMGERLGTIPRRSVIHFGIREGAQSRSWSLRLGPEGTAVQGGRLGEPDLEVLTDSDTWRQIASGSVSPLSAFGSGRMRVIGDLQVARRIASRMAANEEG